MHLNAFCWTITLSVTVGISDRFGSEPDADKLWVLCLRIPTEPHNLFNCKPLQFWKKESAGERQVNHDKKHTLFLELYF